MTLPDDDLRDAFQAARETERPDTPPFARVLAGRPRRRRTLIPWVLAAGAAAAGVLLVAKATRPDGGTAAELELARRVMETPSATGFLLKLPLAGLPSSAPVPGRSPEGSPLRVLDPGGPLGPPVTLSRRIRT